MCAALLAATAVIGATAPAANAEDCPARYVCVWNGVFNGAQKNYGAGYAGWVGEFDPLKYSVKNRLDDRAVWTFNISRGIFYGYDCVNPGEKRGGGSFWARALWIDAPGTRCHP